MISFRYHVVSLVAVLAALAAGIILGGGPLQRTVAADEGDSAQSLADAQLRARTLADQVAFGDEFATRATRRLVAGTLAGHAVTVLALPGADATSVSAVERAIDLAGGRVVARAELTEDLLDAANRQLVVTLAVQLEEAAGSAVDIPTVAADYERLGLLVAHAFVADRTGGSRADAAAKTILAGLETAELVSAPEVTRRGDLVVLVAGAPYGGDDLRAGAASIIGPLATGLAAQSAGIVLAGPVSAGTGDGLVAAVQGDADLARRVATVDVVDTAAGAVVAVLALAQDAGGRAGHYGSAKAADGAVPDAADTRGGR